MTVSAEQWDKIDGKYNGLLWTISHRISGDRALASLEDNHADLQIVALEAVAGFQKKTGRTFDEFWGDKLFDQYIKTCFWNFKNNKGGKIAQRYNINRDVVSTSQNEEVLKLESKNGSQFDFNYFLEDISAQFDEEQREVLEALVRCPSCVKVNGSVNISKVAKKVNKGWQQTSDLVDGLEKVLRP
tara:strand:+ start:192 stop:749 length:558 start_codon:yes stop_codon:yes gene_type:complete